MLSAGAPDITPQNMRFAGAPKYLYGIVKAPDKVMAETHKKTHFADVLKALSGARIFSQRQGKQRRQYLYGIVKLYDDVFAERVRSGECFQCGGEVQKKGEIPTMPCGAIL